VLNQGSVKEKFLMPAWKQSAARPMSY
jgi:hypothetical protein